MYMRVMDSPDGKIVAACDRQLIGRRLCEGKVVLDLEKHAHFYSGEECTRGELEAAFRGAASINLVGEKSVACAIGAGIVQRESVLFIEGVPHLQIYRIK